MKKILVVEDSADVLNNIKYVLTKAGYEALTAQDGEQGVKLAQESLPDLIIMDLMLPKMQGGDAVCALKKLPACKDIPVIILTGLMSNEEEKEGGTIFIEHKRYPTFAKPFDFNKLLKTIENILQSNQNIS